MRMTSRRGDVKDKANLVHAVAPPKHEPEAAPVLDSPVVESPAPPSTEVPVARQRAWISDGKLVQEA